MSGLNMAIVGGCGSSGTTLLAHLLSRHPDIASGPEFNFFNHPEVFSYEKLVKKYKKMYKGKSDINGYIDVHVFMTFREHYKVSLKDLQEWIKNSTDEYELLIHFRNHMLNLFQKKYFVEKSPTNVYSYAEVARKGQHIPIIHMIRDGRDVVTSLMKRGFNLFGAGSRWLYDTVAGLCGRSHPNYLEIRYEELVNKPIQTLNKIFKHLNLATIDNLLNKEWVISNGVYSEKWMERKEPQAWQQTPADPITNASVGRFKKKLTSEQLNILNRITLTESFKHFSDTSIHSFGDLISFLNYKPIELLKNTNCRVFEKQLVREDYYRRMKRFWNNRRVFLPRKFTQISH